MRINHNSHWLLSGILLALPAVCAVGQSTPSLSPTDLAQRQVTAYVAKLADLHCTESVVQEKLTGNGHVEASEKGRPPWPTQPLGSRFSLGSRTRSAALLVQQAHQGAFGPLFQVPGIHAHG